MQRRQILGPRIRLSCKNDIKFYFSFSYIFFLIASEDVLSRFSVKMKAKKKCITNQKKIRTHDRSSISARRGYDLKHMMRKFKIWTRKNMMQTIFHTSGCFFSRRAFCYIAGRAFLSRKQYATKNENIYIHTNASKLKLWK